MADYKDIGIVSPLVIFDIKLAEVSQEFVKKHKPFDAQCARLDFKDKLEGLERESERRYGYIKVGDIKIEPGNLDRYGDEDRFEFLKDEETYGDKVAEDGKKTRGIVGHTIDYKCKQRGHGISVLVPLAEYNERKGKKKKEDK